MTEEIDVEYVRSVGEEVYARLFPAPRADGRVPVALPVAVNYQPVDGVGEEVLFVPLRAIQWVGEGPADDVEDSRVRVFFAGVDYGSVNFVLGEIPEIPEHLRDDRMAARAALIDAVAGAA